MPTTAQQFFFGTIDDDQDFPGVTENVKKLLEAAPGANTTTTVTWTTTTIVEKTVIPLTGSTANGDTTTTNGWAFNDSGADGLGSLEGALRRIPAGVWNFSFQMTLNTAALLDTHALTITAKVYRVADIVGSTGGARTLLFTATSPNQTASATVSWNSASQPEVLLQPGEVVMVGFTATSASTTATVLGANTNTVMTVSLGANTRMTVPAPGIETIAKGIGSSNASSGADGNLAGVGSVIGLSDGISTAAASLSATGATVGASNGLSSGDGALAAVAPIVGSVSSTSAANGQLSGVAEIIGQSSGISTVSGEGATVKPTAGASSSISDVFAILSAIGVMAGNANSLSTVQGSMGAVAEASGFATGSSTGLGALAAVAPTVGSVNVAEGGGGETIINISRPIYLFDD